MQTGIRSAETLLITTDRGVKTDPARDRPPIEHDMDIVQIPRLLNQVPHHLDGGWKLFEACNIGWTLVIGPHLAGRRHLHKSQQGLGLTHLRLRNSDREMHQ